MRKLYDKLCRLEIIICGTGFILLVFFVLLSAVLRFFRLSMSWNIDLALFLLAWTAFLGADIAWRDGGLFGIDLITKRLPPLLQKFVQLAIYVIILCVIVLIIINGSKLAWTERLRKYQSIPIPYSFVILSLVAAALSMVLTTILKIRRCIMSFGQPEKEEAGK